MCDEEINVGIEIYKEIYTVRKNANIIKTNGEIIKIESEKIARPEFVALPTGPSHKPSGPPTAWPAMVRTR